VPAFFHKFLCFFKLDIVQIDARNIVAPALEFQAVPAEIRMCISEILQLFSISSERQYDVKLATAVFPSSKKGSVYREIFPVRNIYETTLCRLIPESIYPP